MDMKMVEGRWINSSAKVEYEFLETEIARIVESARGKENETATELATRLMSTTPDKVHARCQPLVDRMGQLRAHYWMPVMIIPKDEAGG